MRKILFCWNGCKSSNWTLCSFSFFKKWYGMLIILTVSIVIVMSTTNYWILKEEKNERNNSKSDI